MRGSAYRGTHRDAVSLVNSNGLNFLQRGATWPFASLMISKQSVTFKLPDYRLKMPLDAIVAITATKYGYISFHFKDARQDFSFCSLHNRQLVARAYSYGIDTTAVNGRDIALGQVVIGIQCVFALLVISLCVANFFGLLR